MCVYVYVFNTYVYMFFGDSSISDVLGHHTDICAFIYMLIYICMYRYRCLYLHVRNICIYIRICM